MWSLSRLHAVSPPKRSVLAAIVAVALLCAGVAPAFCSSAAPAGATPTRSSAFLEAREASSGYLAADASAALGIERPRSSVPSSSPSTFAAAAPWVCLVATACAASLARASRGSSNARRVAVSAGRGGAGQLTKQSEWIPSGKFIEMTKDEEDAWVDKRITALKEMTGENMMDFDDQVDELTWNWARPEIDKDIARLSLAQSKRRRLLRERGFWEKVRYFKPVAVKYPSLLPKLNKSYGWADPQDSSPQINGAWFANEEEDAGFTYEDWVAQTSGGNFDQWDTVKLGDDVMGTVKLFTKDGVFVELGCLKNMAFLPLRRISLIDVASADEVLEIGQEIKVKVVGKGKKGVAEGEGHSAHVVVSMIETLVDDAWDSLVEIHASGQRQFNVKVMSIGRFGDATVMLDNGLTGIIKESELKSKAGDSNIVGETIEVSLITFPRDFEALQKDPASLQFSYRDPKLMALLESCAVGDVLPATVKQATAFNVTLDVKGVTIIMGKFVVSRSGHPFQLDELFSEDEEIKVYVSKTDIANCQLMVTTRDLEPNANITIVFNKAECFKNAEETAKNLIEASRKTTEDTGARIDSALKEEPKKSEDGGLGGIDDGDGF